MGVTLDQLLASRENRWAKQQALLQENPLTTLVCLTVIMPGSVKRNSQSLIVARAALEAVRTAFGERLLQMEELDLETGYEAYLLVSLSIPEAKAIACDVEEQHPLGRLFDVDVIQKDGAPASRKTIGRVPRRCLLCDRDARYCMRNHSHTQEEIHKRIDQLVADYVQRL
ncbi:citrate lyase holo-[acyl-carrier protein] synthase [uncultured Alloprevotella sp.]|uniref:citrate lyase holo-[acyl-carrier protein] synthase n=1 Tax=uncultured Alloprevotella sp. TaxID=1283315 RepID=UPI0026035FB8|nr:citrate lyase holo-[acyl-carrier protein] synthase [uncultured Alloprevotella sp.]